MIGFVSIINQRIADHRLIQVKQTKLILGYVLIGILLMAILTTLIAVYLTPWLSVLVIFSYFTGLILL